jgi:deferrochelatase/peroxidase EfeB
VSHALVTIISHIAPDRVDAARVAVDALGNPASPEVHAAFEAVATEPGDIAIHFSSLTVFPASAGGGHLVFEFSGDGSQDVLIAALAKHLGPHVAPAFNEAEDRGSDPIDRYWTSHVVTVGQGYFDNPGIVFAGTPGLSVARIRAERALRIRLKALVDEAPTIIDSAFSMLDSVRARLRDDPEFAWALQPEPAVALESDRPVLEAVRKIAPAVIRMYLWPLAIPPAIVFLMALFADFSFGGFFRALMAGFVAGIATVMITIALGLFAYSVFRRRENSEMSDDRPPDPRAVARIMERENHAAQNHLAGLSVMKRGMLRQLTIRLIFTAIAQVATHLFRPGWLGTLGTIHFARWVMVPGTRDLIFLSNYGGSWESYLEDFITKAHNGLTGVWSNTEGFPRTANLIQLGARDGDRFKRWARRQQYPTGCWYSAYPDLTTTNIRTNAAIRQGLGTILTEEEARRWLTLFGSSPRPVSTMDMNQIQSIAFGGLGFLHRGLCLAFRLDDDRDRARAWLGDIRKDVAFGDGRRFGESAIILAVGATALAKLGLPEDSLVTFPAAFLDGMASSARSRMLGDEHLNAPTEWEWGGPANPVDGILLLYADTDESMERIRKKMDTCLTSHGHRAVVDVPFVTLPDKNATKEERRVAKLEPFGFADGISQPVMRGTYKSFRGADPIHLVEPGEFILGYPDNRGNLPAVPTLAAIHDPDNVLPIAAPPQHGFARPIVNDARDLGRNGTFLAARQLEQNYDGFWEYCAQAAAGIRERFPRWTDVTPEYVGSKLVGRWPDGSSLVRFPLKPGSEEPGADVTMIRPGTGSASQTAEAVSSPPIAAAQLQQQRAAPLRKPLEKVERTKDKERPVAVSPDNDFLFGEEDPQGLRCPFGAHIRRANPRESFEPGSREQLAITNRHRILRVGRRYQPKDGRNDGLFFMCLNADLERQFEFIQHTWLQAPSFHGLMGERDPILGSRDADSPRGPDHGFTIPARDSPVRLRGMPEFVRTLGGGYFFVPGKALLYYLSS